MSRSEKAAARELTVRQKIIEALKGHMLSAKDLSKAIGVREKDVLEHLPYVARTISSSVGGIRLVVKPSECAKCGFVFRKRDRFRTPGKCPICKSEEITETRFEVMEDQF